MINPTKAEKREVITAARKMGCKINRNTRWYDNGVRSRLVFQVLDAKHGSVLWENVYFNEYEACLAFLKQSLIDD